MSKRTKMILRGVLILLVAATIGVLAYLYMTQDEPEQANKSDTNSSSEKLVEKSPSQSDDESLELVKNSFNDYLDATYKKEDPDFDGALAAFKKNMTDEGVEKLASAKGDQDHVLCSVGKPGKLSFTEVSSSDGTAVVGVVATMASGTTQAVVTVDTAQNKISNIECQ